MATTNLSISEAFRLIKEDETLCAKAGGSSVSYRYREGYLYRFNQYGDVSAHWIHTEDALSLWTVQPLSELKES